MANRLKTSQIIIAFSLLNGASLAINMHHEGKLTQIIAGKINAWKILDTQREREKKKLKVSAILERHP